MVLHYHKTGHFSRLAIGCGCMYEVFVDYREDMKMTNLTALISTFARAYHYRNNTIHVFADPYAGKILSEEEYETVSHHMTQGIAYFCPGFQGTEEEALQWIVEHQIAPSVLARSAFCERALHSAMLSGCRQIILYACGFETFALRTENRQLKVFELDRPEMIADKRKRLKENGLKPFCRTEYIGCDLSDPAWKEKLVRSGFDEQEQSFGTMLGLVYYLSKEEFRDLLHTAASICPEGAAICFDYPLIEEGEESQKNRELAEAANESMKARYTYEEMEQMLADAGFLIYEHQNAEEADQAFFTAYNQAQPSHEMHAPQGVSYCLAVKKM